MEVPAWVRVSGLVYSALCVHMKDWITLTVCQHTNLPVQSATDLEINNKLQIQKIQSAEERSVAAEPELTGPALRLFLFFSLLFTFFSLFIL